MPSGPVTNREREEMRRLRAMNMPVETIGMRLGRSGRCVHEHVRDMPVRCKPGAPGFGSERYRRLLAAAEAGADPSDLAERFGLSRNSVAPMLSRIRRAQRLAQEHAPC